MSIRLRRTLAVTSAVVLTLWGSTGIASADPGNGQGGGNSAAHGQAQPPGQVKVKAGHGNAHGKSGAHGRAHAPGQLKDKTGNQVNSGADGPANVPGQPGDDAGNVTANGDPPGNNGTIKITPLGERDGIPNNSPHVACGVQIEWYGFDQGDYYSRVSFAMQAPTRDATIKPNGPTSVFVGGDPASGAGTATGLDARESYYPTFTGTPHPKQGFHVKVTVATPFSHGNDTKSKVFWIEPCAGGSPGTPGTPGGGTSTVDTPGAPAVPPSAPGSSVPTVVEAGQAGPSVLDRVRSPLPLLVMAAVLAVAAVGWRRRPHADA